MLTPDHRFLLLKLHIKTHIPTFLQSGTLPTEPSAGLLRGYTHAGMAFAAGRWTGHDLLPIALAKMFRIQKPDIEKPETSSHKIKSVQGFDCRVLGRAGSAASSCV